jgi:hypothetical protein
MDHVNGVELNLRPTRRAAGRDPFERFPTLAWSVTFAFNPSYKVELGLVQYVEINAFLLSPPKAQKFSESHNAVIV